MTHHGHTGPACALCGDNEAPLHLHARCHFTAPLRVEMQDGTLSLFCYVPECNRLVARFKIAGEA